MVCPFEFAFEVDQQSSQECSPERLRRRGFQKLVTLRDSFHVPALQPSQFGRLPHYLDVISGNPPGRRVHAFGFFQLTGRCQQPRICDMVRHFGGLQSYCRKDADLGVCEKPRLAFGVESDHVQLRIVRFN